MSDTSKFWLGINGIIAAAIVGIIISTQMYYKHHNQIVIEMVKSGVDPVAVMCALQDNYGNHPVCLVLAAKK